MKSISRSNIQTTTMFFNAKKTQNTDLWSYDDVQNFYNGLNHCFIYNIPLMYWWNTIHGLYMTNIPFRQIVSYGNYYLSEPSFHNQTPWTDSEHSMFMQMYQLYNLDFTQYAIVMNGKRSLVDIHEHAMQTLPNFSDMAYLCGNGSIFKTETENITMSEQSVIDMTCNEKNIWSESSALSSMVTEIEGNVTVVSDKIFGEVNEIEDNLTFSQFTDRNVMDPSVSEEECNEDTMDQAVSYDFNEVLDDDIDIAKVFHNESDDTLTCYCVSAFHCVCDQSF